MAEQGERINVSRDVLRSELSQLELRLVDRLSAALEGKADKTVVAEHDKRLVALELSRAAREHLSQDVSDHEKRLSATEAYIDSQNGEKKYKQWILPALGAAVGAFWWVPLLFHP